MTSINLERVALSYGSTATTAVPVVKDLTFSISSGEVVALVGRNGSGKSTLLRAIAGLHKADEGVIEFDGTSPIIGWMPQDFRSSIFPWWSVERNILLKNPAKRQHWVEEVAAILAAAGIALQKKAAALSGGQQQIVAFLRAVGRPSLDLLLLDEPFSALDVEHRVQLRRFLLKRTSQSRCTTLVVSHDLLDVALVADRIVVLQGGRVGHVVENRGAGKARAVNCEGSLAFTDATLEVVAEIEELLK